MIELLKNPEFWTLLGAVATSVIAYFAGIRKSKAEATAIEVDNDKEILNTYKAELDYFSKQLIATRQEIAQLRIEISNLLKLACNRPDCPTRLKS